MNSKFKKYKNLKYPNINLYSNMILDEKQLNLFLQNYNKIPLKNKNKDIIIIDKEIKKNLDKKLKHNIYKIIDRNITLEKTFKYIFYNTLTGIYVRILNNRLKIFYLFYNEDYKNDWLNNIKIPKFYNKLKRKYISKDKSKWSVNNCIIDNRTITNDVKNSMEFNRLLEFKYIIKLACKKYKIKDCEFFINRRDFPILRYDGKHPYNHVYEKINKYNNNTFIPIFSQSTSKEYADIPFPTIEDISMLSGIAFPPKNNLIKIPELIDWNKKNNVAFFRGSATGCGVLPETNQRLKLAKISFELNDKNILDAGITSWNNRDKIYNKKMTIINPKKLGFPLSDRVLH